MTIEFNTKRLLDKLSFLLNGVSKGAHIPALLKAKISVHGGTVKGYAYDQVSLSSVTLATGVEGESEEYVIPLNRTVQALKKASEVTRMTLDRSSMKVTFQSGRAKWTEQAEYESAWVRPPMDRYPARSEDVMDLSEPLRRVAWAVDERGTVDAMKGVHIRSNGKLEVVGTDAYTISVYHSDNPIPGFEGNFTIMAEGTDQLMNVMRRGEVQVGVNREYIAVEYEDYRVCSRLLDMAYPNYQAILMNVDDCDTIVVSRKEISDALAVASAFADPSHRALVFSVRGGNEPGIRIGAQPLMDESKASVSIDCTTDIAQEETDEGDEYDPMLFFKIDYKRLGDALRGLSDVEEVMIMVPRQRPDDLITRLALRDANPDGDSSFIQIGLMRIAGSDKEVLA